MKTIKTEFHNNLPAWARNDQSVVALAERDLAFRCDVFAAKTRQMRDLLRRIALAQKGQKGEAR